MSRVCTVCAHAEREAIDKLLVAGEGLRDIAGRYGLSKSALERHKANHLPASLAQAKEAAEVAQADDLLGQLRKLQRITLGLLSKAYSAGDLRTAVAAVGQARGNLELLGKLLGQLDERAQVNVLVASPEWLALRARILTVLENYPEARLALAAALEVGDAGQ
jgi:hypothetical protein